MKLDTTGKDLFATVIVIYHAESTKSVYPLQQKNSLSHLFLQ